MPVLSHFFSQPLRTAAAATTPSHTAAAAAALTLSLCQLTAISVFSTAYRYLSANDSQCLTTCYRRLQTIANEMRGICLSVRLSHT